MFWAECFGQFFWGSTNPFVLQNFQEALKKYESCKLDLKEAGQSLNNAETLLQKCNTAVDELVPTSPLRTCSRQQKVNSILEKNSSVLDLTRQMEIFIEKEMMRSLLYSSTLVVV